MLRNMTKRQAIAAYLVLTLALVGGIALGAKANATEDDAMCTPIYDDVLIEEAIEEEGHYETVIVTPAVEEVTETHAEYVVKEKKEKGKWSANGKNFTGQTASYPGSHGWTVTNSGFYAPGDEPTTGETVTRGDFIHDSNGKWYWTFTKQWFTTGNTSTVVIVEAKDAVTEEVWVVDVEAKDAVYENQQVGENCAPIVSVTTTNAQCVDGEIGTGTATATLDIADFDQTITVWAKLENYANGYEITYVSNDGTQTGSKQVDATPVAVIEPGSDAVTFTVTGIEPGWEFFNFAFDPKSAKDILGRDVGGVITGPEVCEKPVDPSPSPEPTPDVTPPAEPEEPVGPTPAPVTRQQEASSTSIEECAPNQGRNTRGQCVTPTFTG